MKNKFYFLQTCAQLKRHALNILRIIYVVKSINDNPKSKVKHHICLQCSLYENQERFPFIASKAIEGVLDDKNAEILIVKDLKFGTKKVILMIVNIVPNSQF